jgi:hypothetical protein
MDWLEEFFPFLRELDNGSGALEVALVVVIVGVLGVIGLGAVQRRRLEATRRRNDADAPDEIRRIDSD